MNILNFISFLNLSGREDLNMANFEYVNGADAAAKTGPRPPLDFSYHFSRVTAARKQSSVKSFYKYFQIPGIGNLAGGALKPIVLRNGWMPGQNLLGTHCMEKKAR